jgi:hypothetical protein
MNAIAALNARALAPDPLAARRRVAEARLESLHGTWLRSDRITLHVLPGATPEERIAIATLLLADTGARVTTED